MVYLVRHAHAGSQKRWPGPDLEVNSSVGEDGQLLAIRIPHST